MTNNDHLLYCFGIRQRQQFSDYQQKLKEQQERYKEVANA